MWHCALLLALVGSVAGACVRFTGALALAASQPLYWRAGERVALTWTLDSRECAENAGAILRAAVRQRTRTGGVK